MKTTYKIACAALLLSFGATTQSFAQEATTAQNVKKYHLYKINYLSANARVGFGMASSKMANSNNWETTGGSALFMGAGINFVLKNSIGFDLQLNHNRAKFGYKNIGPTFKSGYNSLGAELGIKKIIPKKLDDSFFVRGAFGLNFLVNANDSYSSDYYNYNSAATGGLNMYISPEIGYQYRFKSPYHLIDVSVLYRYSLSEMANTQMVFTDKGNANETNTGKMSGTYFGISLRYSYMIKGFKKKAGTDRVMPDKIF